MQNDKDNDPLIPFFDKLQQFDPGFSHQADPTRWLCLNTEHVTELGQFILQYQYAIKTFECSRIYPRFILYTLARIVLCSDKPSMITDLLKFWEIWKTWDDISALANHQSVKNDLMSCLDEVHRSLGDDPDPGRTVLSRILTIDAIVMDALLLHVLEDTAQYRHLLKRRDNEAQSLLDLLQARLGLPLELSLKPYYTRALMKLSRASGLYPECMTLKGIELDGRAPVEGGGFSDIWKGFLGGQEISVKVLRVYQKSDKIKLFKDFSSEAVTWQQLKHPNVLPFYGVVHMHDDRLCLASPWMHNGNIVRFLESAPETKCAPLMLDIAEGLKYLHTFRPCIIHADLKGFNILITQSHRACLADFGLATVKDMTLAITSTTTTGAKGTLRWQAPELLNPGLDKRKCSNSVESDVYAYGCVCYEIFSGQLSFHDKTEYQVMVELGEGRRPPHPSNDLSRIRGLDDTIWNIIESCWSQEPSRRPSAYQIVESLRTSQDCAADRRPFDEFDVSFPAQTAYSQAEHPFMRLVGVVDDKSTYSRLAAQPDANDLILGSPPVSVPFNDPPSELRYSTSHPNLQDHEEDFSSAFGLISIDKPYCSGAEMNIASQDSNITPNKQTRYRNGLSASSLTRPGDSTLDAVRTNQHHKADGLWSFDVAALFWQDALVREVVARKLPLNISGSKLRKLKDEISCCQRFLSQKHKCDGCYQQDDSNGINNGGPREGRSSD